MINLFGSKKSTQPDDEKTSAQKWKDKIKEGRKFDALARKQYAIDRKYARGDKGGFIVHVPLAGSYIHILKSFLYAKNPDVDALPAESAEPPPDDGIQKLAKQSVLNDPVAQEKLRGIAQNELQQATPPPSTATDPTGAPPTEALSAAVNAAQQAESQMVAEKFRQIMDPYIQMMEESKSLGETLERVIRRLWTGAKLRHEAALWVSSGLTVGVGWLKCMWIDGELVIDFVAAEDMQVSPQAPYLNSYADASWIAQRVFLPIPELKTRYPALGDKLKSATTYYRRKETSPNTVSDIGSVVTVDAKDADTYSTSHGDAEETTANGAIWEIWDKTSEKVITLIEGVEGYAKPSYSPDPKADRFYPFFLFAPVEIDGERHPQSLIQRSMSLFDEYSRRLSRWSVICARSIPKTAFDSTLYSELEIKKLQNATDQEMIGLHSAKPGQPIRDALTPIAYSNIDMALFDIGPIRAELEIVWGIQEALASSIQTPKTATEAQIEQSGSNSRLAFMRPLSVAPVSQIEPLVCYLCTVDSEDGFRFHAI